MLDYLVRIARRHFRFAGVPLFSRAFVSWVRTWCRSIPYRHRKYSTLNQLLETHYATWSEPAHRTKAGMVRALSACDDFKLIVETGTSAWGCDSSRLFDMVAKLKDAKFVTVDIRPEASLWLRHQVSERTSLFVQDSVDFLTNTLAQKFPQKIDFAYLDSFDLDYSDPRPSEEHCWAEFVKVCKFSRIGTVVLIDDSPSNLSEVPEGFQNGAKIYFERHGRLPGKGSLILEKIRSNENFEILWHSENLVIRILKNNPFSDSI